MASVVGMSPSSPSSSRNPGDLGDKGISVSGFDTEYDWYCSCMTVTVCASRMMTGVGSSVLASLVSEEGVGRECKGDKEDSSGAEGVNIFDSLAACTGLEDDDDDEEEEEG